MHVYIYTTSLKGYFATKQSLTIPYIATSTTQKNPANFPQTETEKKKSRNVGCTLKNPEPREPSPDIWFAWSDWIDWWTRLGNDRCRGNQKLLHPGRLTWTTIMEVWKIIFLSKWVNCRFHVNLPGCIPVQCWWYCWWIRNPANQLRLVVHPIVIE